jgi:hypothetical protein
VLQLTEPESLAIRGVHANVGHVLNVVNGGIRIHRRPRGVNDQKTIGNIRNIELVDRTLGEEDRLEIVLGSLLRIRPCDHRQVLGLARILGKKTHESLNRKIQTLAIRITIAVKEHHGLLRNPELTAKSRPIRKRLENLGIRSVLQNLHLCLRTPRELRLVDISPLGRERLHRLASLIDAIQKRLGNPKIDLVKIGPDLEVSLLTIVTDGLQKLVDDERIVLEKHELRVDRINLLGKLVEAKALLARILGGGRILRNHTLRNLAVIGVARMTLESKVKDLDLGRKRRHLAKKIVGDLGVSCGLINVRAHKKNSH